MRTLVTGDGGFSASRALTQLAVITRHTFTVIDSLTDEGRIQNLYLATKHRSYPKDVVIQ